MSDAPTSTPHHNTWRAALTEKPVPANDDAPECGNCIPFNWRLVLALLVNAACIAAGVALFRFTFGI